MFLKFLFNSSDVRARILQRPAGVCGFFFTSISTSVCIATLTMHNEFKCCRRLQVLNQFCLSRIFASVLTRYSPKQHLRNVVKIKGYGMSSRQIGALPSKIRKNCADCDALYMIIASRVITLFLHISRVHFTPWWF